MIKLYGDDSFDGEYVVSPEGGVALPLVGVLPTAGLSLPEFEQVVERKLSNGFYHNPALTMEITRFRPFYIIGEVQRPGQYAFVPGLTLKKAVAIAGGYTYRANRKRFDVQRENLDRVVRVSTEPDVKIGPGDTVTILERFF